MPEEAAQRARSNRSASGWSSTSLSTMPPVDEAVGSLDEIRIRSLRRLFFRACQEDDRDAAILIYRATSEDWDAWIQLERDMEGRKQQEEEKRRLELRPQHRQRRASVGSVSALLRPLSGRRGKGDRVAAANTASSPGLQPTVQPAPTSLTTVKAAGVVRRGSGSGRSLGSAGLLQQRMNPSECFVLDDYLPLDGPYDKDCRAAQNAWLERMQQQQQQQLDSSPTNATLGGRDPWQARGMPHPNHPHHPQSFGSAPPPRRSFLPWSSSSRLSRREQELEEHLRIQRNLENTTADFATSRDSRRTTPLHEAARMGHAELVALMLRHPGADVTERNGEHCTPLHSVAGGVTSEELQVYQSCHARQLQKVRREAHLADTTELAEKDQDDESTLSLGIEKPGNVLDPPSLSESQSSAPSPRNPHASRLARILRPTSAATSTKPSSDSASTTAAGPEHSGSVDPGRLASIELDRRKAALTLLNWSHPDDGSPLSGLGVSVNAVDLRHGRTALHYAAELGRAEICLAISESFGANLTIVDDRGKTPCELAAEHGSRLAPDDGQASKSLAAQLEARALLHVDYDSMGNEDELMASFMSQQSDDADGYRKRLVPPFCWFETRSLPFVQSTRESRLCTAEYKIKELVRLEVQERSACRAMYESDSSDDDDNNDGNVDVALAESDNETPSSTTIVKSHPAGANVTGNSSVAASHRRGDTNETLGSAPAYEWVVDPSGVVTESQPEENADDDEQEIRPLDVCQESEEADGASSDVPVVTPSKDGSAGDSEAAERAQGEAPSTTTSEKDVPTSLIETSPSSEALEEAYKGDVKVSHTVSTTFSSESNSRIQTSSSADSTGVVPTARTKAPDGRVAETDTDLYPFLNIHKAHVQLFLEAHGWDVHKALSAFVQDSRRAFCDANVDLPAVNVLKPSNEAASTLECLICCEEFESGEAWTSLESCGHAFCRDCLGNYIANLAKSKSGLVIPCPHHDCQAPLTGYEVASLAPTMDVYEALLNAANEDFVVRASDFTFCPHPSCSGIVHFQAPAYVKNSGMDPTLLHIVGAVCTAAHPSINTADGCRLTYEGVSDPRYTDAFSKEPTPKAHRFCFACGDAQHHWPVTCEHLSKWKSIVKDQVSRAKQSGDGMDSDNYNEVAQELWLKTYTRPCPKCKARIEKVDGCNHMTCSNPRCKHEFCWICRNDWSLHNTQTGGFFRCNRWVDQKDEHEYYDAPPEDPQAALNVTNEDLSDPNTMAVTYGTAIHASLVARKRQKEMARFLHHYQRWSAHAESASLESKMGDTAQRRLAPVVEAAAELDGRPDFNFDGEGLSFVYDAFSELLECRSMLQHSYAHSYFRYDLSPIKRSRALKRRMTEKAAFEQIQAELEMLTEQLSNVVARSHLRATQAQIKYLTRVAAEKRKEFSNTMLSVHMAERKELDEHSTTPPDMEVGGEVQRFLYRLQGLRDDVLHRDDRLRTASTRAPPALLHRRIGSNDTDVAIAAVADAPPRVARDAARLREHRRGSSSDTDRAIYGGMSASVTDDAYPSVTGFTAASDDALEEAIRASLQEFNAVTSPAASILEQVQRQEEDDTNDAPQEWSCVACTFVNTSGRRCAMCRTRRAG